MHQDNEKSLFRFAVPAALLSTSAFAVYIAVYSPGYLSSAYYLGGLIFLQILLVAIWNYQDRFFPLMVAVFFWAGTSIPLNGVWTSGRWWVLAVGAIVGFALYMRSARHHFETFHLVAFFCVTAALVSGMVSSLPVMSSLKALSLLLLFLYGSTGARLALAGREQKFFPRLLFGTEIFVYLTAVVYLIFRYPVLGNPNSMGAIMGVIAVPLLFWGLLITEARTRRRRMTFVLMLSLILLFYSQARAGILAGTIACVLTCVAMRRYRLLIQGTMAAVCVALLAVVLTPSEQAVDMPIRHDESSISSFFLYKGHEDVGVMGSRQNIWDQTASVIREHPWFGSGFGTTVGARAEDSDSGEFTSSYSSYTTREHGNSYLATMEGVGLLGVVPFTILVLMLALKVGGVFAWLRRTGNLRHYSVPAAMILAAGLIHAGFEDWLFAVGYYLCVFFWMVAFTFLDLLPANLPAIYRPITDFTFRTRPQSIPAVASER
jgi:O-antigen ligase